MVKVPLLFIAIAALFTGGMTALRTPDATTVLADMRRALGGDAIAAVRAFSVETTEERHFLGRSMPTNVEWVCILPDRFIQVRRFRGRTGQIAQTTGFSGDDLIQTLGGDVRPPPIAARVAIAEARAATRRASLTAARQHFSRLMIGMLGITAAYPLDAAYVVQETLDGKPVHVLELTAAGGYQSRLYVDTATHLPRMISWMGKPDPSPQTRPPGDPSALPLVERRIFFSDYKSSGGLNWPHRLKEVVAKQTVTETRLGKFTINPAIDPSRFAVASADRP